MRQYLLCLVTIVLFAVCGVQAQEASSQEEYPILGHFRFGMTYGEYSEQLQKFVSDSRKEFNGLTVSQISIAGIDFNLESYEDLDIEMSYTEYERYDRNQTTTFFGGYNVFLQDTIDLNKPVEERLVAFSIKSAFNTLTIPMTYYKDPGFDRVINVEDITYHNHLVDNVDTLCTYLTKKFGKPTQKYVIEKKKTNSKSNKKLNAKILYRISPKSPESIHGSYDFIPKAIWEKDNCQIVLGIELNGTLSLSFIDTSKLSHSNLDKLFTVKE